MTGKLLEARRDDLVGARESFAARAKFAFREFVRQPEFPCVGAKSAFNSSSYQLSVYGPLAEVAATESLAIDLYQFTRSQLLQESDYATFIAIFAGPHGIDEMEFEKLLWRQLSQLNQRDAAQFDWDPTVRSDPTDPHFSFSFAGQSLYVIGMHARSSREARRFQWPTLVFNPHEQFERLRSDGRWKKMQETIRDRDYEVQGSTNPMLSDFGEQSEARQYSGRAVEENWTAPFSPAQDGIPRTKASRCPFSH